MHLKTIVINRLKWDGFDFVSLPRTDTPHKRGVHYFCPPVEVKTLWGAMDTRKEGQHYKKRIVVRPSRFRLGLFELYAYHFPKHWSAACVANRELIKEAQKQAHAIEHDHSLEALTWRVRFFSHYFTVVKGGAKPEDGMKRYTRFYQYTYVSIYRQLQAERKKAAEPEPIVFEPVITSHENESITNYIRCRFGHRSTYSYRAGTSGIWHFPSCLPRADSGFAELPKWSVPKSGADAAVHGKAVSCQPSAVSCQPSAVRRAETEGGDRGV